MRRFAAERDGLISSLLSVSSGVFSDFKISPSRDSRCVDTTRVAAENFRASGKVRLERGRESVAFFEALASDVRRARLKNPFPEVRYPRSRIKYTSDIDYTSNKDYEGPPKKRRRR